MMTGGERQGMILQ